MVVLVFLVIVAGKIHLLAHGLRQVERDALFEIGLVVILEKD